MVQIRPYGTAAAIERAIARALEANEIIFAKRLAAIATHLSTPHYSSLALPDDAVEEPAQGARSGHMPSAW